MGDLGAVPDSIASGEGLEDAVAASPALLLQTDEADVLLTAMRGADSRASRMNEMLLRFFTESRGAHAMRQLAGDGAVRIIREPHLTMLATGIPKFFYRYHKFRGDVCLRLARQKHGSQSALDFRPSLPKLNAKVQR